VHPGNYCGCHSHPVMSLSTSSSVAPQNNEMQLTRSARVNGMTRPLQLISVLCGRPCARRV
jgi:hypothetical protein